MSTEFQFYRFRRNNEEGVGGRDREELKGVKSFNPLPAGAVRSVW